jgi:CRISPR-associated endonuclease/helicase Cas3
MFFAHSKGENNADWQKLGDHLINTSNIVKYLTDSKFFGELAEIAAFLHDVGKYSEAFQNRLNGSKKHVDHSSAGAQLVKELAGVNRNKQFIADLIAYCIAGHHSGLPDYGSKYDHPSNPTLLARLKREIEDYSNFFDEFDLNKINIPDQINLSPTRADGQFSISFLVRMIYSSLVDADFLETESFFRNDVKRGCFPSINGLFEKTALFLEQFQNPTSAINIKRTELLNDCLSQAHLPKGLFSLIIPTGGGKTFTSLAFALKHAKQHNLCRVVYCIPFTSIIEQTAESFRKILGADVVLEHHSNFDWHIYLDTLNLDGQDKLKNTAVQKLKHASENWDIPIIITTNVQFFESLFSNKSSRCRKLHSLVNSAIIFDEAQMIPLDYLEPCMMGLAELITNYGSSIIFCTATQPPLEKFFQKNIQQKALISNPEDNYRFFKRVSVKNIGTKTDEEISELMNSKAQVLCIVNTRKHANGLFSMIKECGRFHLSTLMCPDHRKKVIHKIKSQLITGDTCRVVSTQILEAGVDIDFPVGLRALAGLDSIVQTAGRINRENRYQSSVIFVFQPDSNFVKIVPAYIRQTSDVARIIMDQYKDPISIEALDAYYQLIFDLQSRDAFDKKSIMACFEKGIIDEPNFDFKTASERFKLIENDTTSVIIPWNKHAENEIHRLKFSEYPSTYLRTLQPYTVNIYPQEFAALWRSGFIDIVQERFAILKELSEEVYNPEMGLVIPDDAAGDAIII